MTNELSNAQQRALADCLRALDAGDSVEAALAGHPAHAGALRPLLEMRARLLAAEAPAPHPAAFQAGRQALLDRLASPRPIAETAASPFAALLERWRVIGSPAARFAAIAAAVGVLGLGALGASAAGGVGPGRDVLSALRIVPADDDASSGAGSVDGETSGQQTPPAGDPDASGQPEEVPGVGLCFEGDRTPPPGLSEDVLVHVPDAGLCVPEALVEHQPDGRPCLPAGLIDRFPELTDVTGDDALCGTGDHTPASPDSDAATPDHPTGPPQDAGPPDGVPVPTDKPNGPPDGAGGPPDGTGQPGDPGPPEEPPGQ